MKPPFCIILYRCQGPFAKSHPKELGELIEKYDLDGVWGPDDTKTERSGH